MLFINGNIVLADGIIENGSLATHGDQIAALSAQRLAGDQVYDLKGRHLIPGYVDIHCHGGGDWWFFEDPARAADHHLQAGTTSLLCSLWRNAGFGHSFETAIRRVVAAAQSPHSPIRGIHMEGPYNDPDLGSDGGSPFPIDPADYTRWIAAGQGQIRVWTLDPCLAGARDFARTAQAHGITLAVCYSKAGPDLLASYLPYGLRIGSHIYCATGAPEPRFGGTVEPGSDYFVLDQPAMVAELIADSLGAHVRPFLLNFVYKLKGPRHIALVSDCCTGGDALGSDVNIIDGVLYGSQMTLSTGVRNMRQVTGASLVDCCLMASTTPAAAIGLTDRGAIRVGHKADLLVVDDQLQVQAVFQDGRQVR